MDFLLLRLLGYISLCSINRGVAILHALHQKFPGRRKLSKPATSHRASFDCLTRYASAPPSRSPLRTGGQANYSRIKDPVECLQYVARGFNNIKKALPALSRWPYLHRGLNIHSRIETGLVDSCQTPAQLVFDRPFPCSGGIRSKAVTIMSRSRHSPFSAGHCIGFVLLRVCRNLYGGSV